MHGWALSADATGYIVFFEAEFYQRHYPASRLHGYPFFDPGHQPVSYLTPAVGRVPWIMEELWAEVDQLEGPNQEIRGLLFLLLENAVRYHPTKAPAPAAALGRQQVREFSRLLNQHCQAQKTVAFYAGALHVSPNHLTAICQRVVGHPARDLILGRVMAEAQRRLHHSAESVAQPALALGYDDASYFSRAFKKHVGVTPEAFRRQR